MYDTNNIFAKIIRGEIPAEKIYEDEKLLAIHDIAPKAKIHVLVIPKGEYVDLADFTSKAHEKDIKHFFEKLHEIAANLDLVESGYRVICNKGKNATQTVFHFHAHILGGELLSQM